jgi:hypothetical protein
MTSKWRKQETFKENTMQTSRSENFSNIPMFDVLQNDLSKNANISKDKNMKKKKNTTVEDNNSNNPIIEGYKGKFDWEGLDYFHHRGVYNISNNTSKIKEYIEKIMSYFSSPITNLDSMFEKFIYDMLIMILMLNNLDCDNETLSKIKSVGAMKSFFWISNRKTEGFSLNDQPYLIKTIDSFEKNHMDFIKDNDTKMKVGTFYIKTLNSYETKLRRRITTDELFSFNNDFDNLLNDPKIQAKIFGIIPTTDWKSKYNSGQVIFENTEEDYKKYYDKHARFKIDNMDNISYYKLNDNYFPIPIFTGANKSGLDILNDAIFECEDTNIMLTRSKFDDLNRKNKYKFKSFNILSTPPVYTTQAKPNINYVFSVDLTNPIEDSIQVYLTYVIKYYSLFIFSKLTSSNYTTFGFQEIEARVGTLYTNLLNRLEFLHYNKYREYLDSYRVAIFNHIFFILIQQEDSGNNNVYNNIDNKYIKIIDDNDTDSKTNKITAANAFNRIIVGNNERYLEIRSQDDLDNMNSLDINNLNFPSMKNNTNKLSNTNSQNFDTGELPTSNSLNPYIDIKNTEVKNKLLFDYILNSDFKQKDIDKYFIPGPLSECEKLKRRVRNEFTNYAKIIKNEIYRILLIPIILYVVYNFYYMFFFRDCDGRVRYENGEYINQGFSCKNPTYPDWESYFHSYENHNTDVIFEYIFKPAKFMYTILNALKAIIRTLPLIGIDSNIIPPYIYLFSTFLIVYDTIKKKGPKIMSFYSNFYNTFSLPNNTYWNNLEKLVKSLTIMFFSLSVVKDIAGFNWHETLQRYAINVDNTLFEKEPSSRSWLLWLILPPTFIIMFFKFVIFILYWIFKYFAATALIPFAIFVAVIYITYTSFFAIYNNSNSECDYSSKVELINRIIYTRLYDVPKEPKGFEYVKYIFKSICWIIMAFMTEIFSLYILKKGLHNITDKIGGSTYAETIKLVLIIIYSCIFGIIGLWCLYKYKFKLPILETFFSREKDDPPPFQPPQRTATLTEEQQKRYHVQGEDGQIVFNEYKYGKDINIYKKYQKIKSAQDRRFTLVKNKNCDTYEILSENKAFKILFGSDLLNAIMIKEEVEKKKKLTEDNKNKPSLVDHWSGKIFNSMGDIGDRLLQKGQNIMENLENKSSDGSKLLDTVKNIGSIAISKTSDVSKTVGETLQKINNEAVKDSTSSTHIKESIKDKMSNISNVFTSFIPKKN